MPTIDIDYAELERTGYSLAVTSIQVRYLAPAHYGERVTVRTWVEEIRSRQLTFGYEIVNTENGTRLVTGQSELVCLDRHAAIAAQLARRGHQIVPHPLLLHYPLGSQHVMN